MLADPHAFDRMKDGGYAFPRPDERAPDGCGIAEGSNGMTLRDYFAAAALPLAYDKFKAGIKEYEIVQLCGDRGGIKGQELIAAVAYELADAMLARRERG